MGAATVSSDFSSAKWVKVSIGLLCELVNGRAFKKNERSDSGLPIIRIQNLNNSAAKYNYFSGEYDDRILIKYGDLLFAWSGTPGTSFGAHVWRGDDGLLNQHIYKIIFPKQFIDTSYFQFALNSKLNEFVSGARGGVGLRHITKKQFEETEILLPPLNEQRRIAENIQELQSKTASARKALEATKLLLGQYRQSILAAAFRGDLTAQWREQNKDVELAVELLERIRVERRARWEEAELAKMREKGKEPKNDKWKAKYKEPEPLNTEGFPELPEGWCWGTVAELASDQPRSIQSGPFGSNLKHSEFRKEGVLAIGIDNVQECRFSLGRENRISEEKYTELEKYTARPLDVLITVMATVGRCCVVPQDVEKSIITKHVYRISVEKELYDSFLLMYALVGAETVLSYIEDNTRGQTRAGINGTILKELPVPIPPRDEQEQIVKILDKQLSSVKDQQVRMDSMLQQLEALDQAVLSKAFRGELVPQNPNDEPASVLLEKIAAERAELKKASMKTSRKPRKVKKTVDDKSLLKVINELPTDSFTFDELAAKVNADYEVVKEALFKLLESDSSGLTQIFDKEAEIVKIKKG